MKKIMSIVMCCVMGMTLFSGCSKPADKGSTAAVSAAESKSEDNTAEEKKEKPEKTYKLTLAANNAMVANTVNYICEEKGWFEDAGLEIERLGFEGGPVQMEAIDSWDICLTGIGGVLAGTVANDTPILAAVQWDCATHYLWARKDSPIVQAGQGHNKYGENIYGTAETWKGAEVFCPSGNTLNYMLAKTLDGFGLTTDDINWVVMDAPNANTAFLSGEGDVAATWAGLSFAPDKEQFVAVSTGLDVHTDVMTNIVANPESYADPEKREAMKIYLKCFMEACDYVSNNMDEAADYLVDLFADDGETTDHDAALYMLEKDYLFGLERCHELMNTKSEEGDYSLMDQDILGVLNYYISVGNFAEGDDQKYLGHCDPTLINELYEESK